MYSKFVFSIREGQAKWEGGKKQMFKRTQLIIRNRQLQKENMELYRENKENREDIENLELQTLHCKLLVEHIILQLNKLEMIDRSGNTEERKRQERNIIYNELRQRNMSIKEELSSKLGSGR